MLRDAVFFKCCQMENRTLVYVHDDAIEIGNSIHLQTNDRFFCYSWRTNCLLLFQCLSSSLIWNVLTLNPDWRWWRWLESSQLPPRLQPLSRLCQWPALVAKYQLPLRSSYVLQDKNSNATKLVLIEIATVLSWYCSVLLLLSYCVFTFSDGSAVRTVLLPVTLTM